MELMKNESGIELGMVNGGKLERKIKEFRQQFEYLRT
jgi:hypothetical protein